MEPIPLGQPRLHAGRIVEIFQGKGCRHALQQFAAFGDVPVNVLRHIGGQRQQLRRIHPDDVVAQVRAQQQCPAEGAGEQNEQAENDYSGGDAVKFRPKPHLIGVSFLEVVQTSMSERLTLFPSVP